MPLTKNQVSACAKLLEQLDPGMLPLAIFSQVARLVRLPIVNVIPVRREASQDEIGLIRRGDDDPWWPGQWHLPGTIIRSTDTLVSAIQRLLHEEIIASSYDEPIYQTFVFQRSKRGSSIVLVYSVDHCVVPATSLMRWHPIDVLPAEIIDSEREIIEVLQREIGHS